MGQSLYYVNKYVNKYARTITFTFHRLRLFLLVFIIRANCSLFAFLPGVPCQKYRQLPL